jgi:prepilin-type N-terminal cleavage/methylation domain-containing protein
MRHSKNTGIVKIVTEKLFKRPFILKVFFSNRYYKRRAAFTLAEVLITLLIIGIISSLVIPGLIADSKQAETVVTVKKIYYTMSTATKLIITQNGSPRTWIWQDHTDQGVNNIMELYLPYMNNLRQCPPSDNIGCKYPVSPVTLSGAAWHWGENFGSNTYKWIFADGTYMGLDIFSSENEIVTYFGVKTGMPINGVFWIDVNGYKKPNQIGRDVFAFVMTVNGLVPAGRDNNSANCSKNPSMGTGIDVAGADCAAKILKEGAMNY